MHALFMLSLCLTSLCIENLSRLVLTFTAIVSLVTTPLLRKEEAQSFNSIMMNRQIEHLTAI